MSLKEKENLLFWRYIYGPLLKAKNTSSSDFKSSHYPITAKQGSALHHPAVGREAGSLDPQQEFNRQLYWTGCKKLTIHLTVCFCKWAMYQEGNEEVSLNERNQFTHVVNLIWAYYEKTLLYYN